MFSANIMDAFEDSVLVALAKQGECGAFDQLFVKYRIRLLGHVKRMVFVSADAEDVIQETFIRAFRGIGSFKGECSFFTWIFKIALRCVFSFKRRDNKRIVAAPLSTNLDEGWEGFDILQYDSNNPADKFQRNELLGCIDRKLVSMPEIFAETFILREVEGLPYEQIAEQMQCSIGTVRSRLFRARHMISASMTGM